MRFCFVFVFLFCFFLSDVLTYCVMLQAFIMLLFFRQMFLMCARARARVCGLFIGIVQRN